MIFRGKPLHLLRKPLRSRDCALIGLAMWSLPVSAGDLASARRGTYETQLKEVSLCDCLLPPQVRRLGRRATYLSRTRAVRTTIRDCEIRGGEYVLEDRADYGVALRVWLPDAEAGKADAQGNVGAIYERGVGGTPDYARAAEWYLRAAGQGLKSAQVSLGHLYENGLGVPRDTTQARYWYELAAELPRTIVIDEPHHPFSPISPTRAASGISGEGPIIEIIEPQLKRTRGLNVVTGADEKVTMIGRATTPHGLFSILVDGSAIAVDSTGLFQKDIARSEGRGEVVIVAVDKRGKRSEYTLVLDATTSIGRTVRPDSFSMAVEVADVSRVDFGSYKALIIANTDYRLLPDLETPPRDAEAIASILRGGYGFDVTVVRDATLYDVLSALNELRKSLTENDNLLLYYAGHGQLDEHTLQGYWLPVDAELDSDANWIPTSRISMYLQAIPAKQILIISDSCFSGALTRSCIARLDRGLTSDERSHWYRVMSRKKARVALTSGGLTPVMDAGGGELSVFNRALTEVLDANQEILETQSLYRQVAARVAHIASEYGMQQEPECAPIRHAGHEAGDFLFVPKKVRTSRGGSR